MSEHELESAMDRMRSAFHALHGRDDGNGYIAANYEGLLKGLVHAIDENLLECMTTIIRNRAKEAENDLVIKTLKGDN